MSPAHLTSTRSPTKMQSEAQSRSQCVSPDHRAIDQTGETAAADWLGDDLAEQAVGCVKRWVVARRAEDDARCRTAAEREARPRPCAAFDRDAAGEKEVLEGDAEVGRDRQVAGDDDLVGGRVERRSEGGQDLGRTKGLGVRCGEVEAERVRAGGKRHGLQPGLEEAVGRPDVDHGAARMRADLGEARIAEVGRTEAGVVIGVGEAGHAAERAGLPVRDHRLGDAAAISVADMGDEAIERIGRLPDPRSRGSSGGSRACRAAGRQVQADRRRRMALAGAVKGGSASRGVASTRRQPSTTTVSAPLTMSATPSTLTSVPLVLNQPTVLLSSSTRFAGSGASSSAPTSSARYGSSQVWMLPGLPARQVGRRSRSARRRRRHRPAPWCRGSGRAGGRSREGRPRGRGARRVRRVSRSRKRYSSGSCR